MWWSRCDIVTPLLRSVLEGYLFEQEVDFLIWSLFWVLLIEVMNRRWFLVEAVGQIGILGTILREVGGHGVGKCAWL